MSTNKSFISTRQYKPGDEIAINKLYENVTGRTRSAPLFKWQWCQSPAGMGEMWLIEYKGYIIGHHGIMPFYFSYGSEDLIVGKTENTMVHKDYRRKILYPRHEKKFLETYKNKFSALFSTTGPLAPLRQRKALGYKDRSQWINYVWSLNSAGIVSLARKKISKKQGLFWKSANKALNFGEGLLSLCTFKKEVKYITILSDEEATQSDFFETFWKKARADYPFTPRRNKEDLAWRFWNNPYNDYMTFVYKNSKSSGYAIIHTHDKKIYELDDIVVFPYTQDNFTALLTNTLHACKNMGGSLLRFSTTDDPASPNKFIQQMNLYNLREKWPFRSFYKESTPSKMLRYVTPKGENKSLCEKNWYITPFIFEGRS